ncbi:hypothetical protein VL762_12115 [Flavobacterium psychrophilum]|uniref:hypothetical protein n=1 Tax=Flavobacterium psychrophilum TaxID=96345 RepID=UPI002C3E053B|nr:hypothetical protein [Flavobacterium psychrophilum]
MQTAKRNILNANRIVCSANKLIATAISFIFFAFRIISTAFRIIQSAERNMTYAFRNIASANRIMATANWNEKKGHHITAVSQNVGFGAFLMLVLYLQNLVINRKLRLIKSHTSGSHGTLWFSAESTLVTTIVNIFPLTFEIFTLENHF